VAPRRCHANQGARLFPHGHAAGRPYRAGLRSDDREVVPVDVELGPVQAEELGCDTKLKGAESVIGNGDDRPVAGFRAVAHDGRILVNNGKSATRGECCLLPF